MRSSVDRIGSGVEYLTGSRSPRAFLFVAAMVLVALAAATALLWLDESRVLGVFSAGAGVGLIRYLRAPARRPPDSFMTIGLFVAGVCTIGGGTFAAAAGSEAPYVTDVALVGVLLAGAGYARLRRRHGVKRSHQLVAEWIAGLLHEPDVQDRRVRNHSS